MDGELVRTDTLGNFAEDDPDAVIGSPRSLQACAVEGVAAQDLIYKPIEAFTEKGLEPRLVKLRYDFFEAKRKDLLAACRRSRETILDQEDQERRKYPTGLTLAELSRKKGVSSGVLQALQSDSVRQERQRMAHAQHLQLKWLQNTLAHQLQQTQALENADKFLAEEAANNDLKEKEAAERMKKQNEERKEKEGIRISSFSLRSSF